MNYSSTASGFKGNKSFAKYMMHDSHICTLIVSLKYALPSFQGLYPIAFRVFGKAVVHHNTQQKHDKTYLQFLALQGD